jgi:hypothetical protein
MNMRRPDGTAWAAGSEPDPEELESGVDAPAAGSALADSRAQLRELVEGRQRRATGSSSFPRSRLMRAALDSRYRPLLLAGGAAAVLLLGRRMPALRIAALVKGYRLARSLWAARGR